MIINSHTKFYMFDNNDSHTHIVNLRQDEKSNVLQNAEMRIFHYSDSCGVGRLYKKNKVLKVSVKQKKKHFQAQTGLPHDKQHGFISSVGNALYLPRFYRL